MVRSRIEAVSRTHHPGPAVTLQPLGRKPLALKV
jgi:hypothetical protein